MINDRLEEIIWETLKSIRSKPDYIGEPVIWGEYIGIFLH